MLSTLVDESTIVYIALILLCSGLLFAWRRTRKRWYLVGTGLGFILVIGFAILTHLVVTDRQKIENTIRHAAAAVERRDVEGIRRALANDFRFHSADRRKFIETGREILQHRNVRELAVWDIGFDSFDKRNGTARISFMAKPRGNWSEGIHYRVEADLVRESDGQWRVRTFEVFKPFVDAKEPQPIPGF
jgi:hypothetical protein